MPILRDILGRLQIAYGKPPAPRRMKPFEMVLWENVAYLVDDEPARGGLSALRERVGTKPADILTARKKVLLEVAKLGGNPAGALREEDVARRRDGAGAVWW
jgi:hypothetical protein